MIAVQSTAAPVLGQDDLAALLARNLTLSPTPAPAPVFAMEQPIAPAAPAAPAVPVAPVEEHKISYCISQHYNHSAHLARHPVVVEPSPQPVQEPQQQPQQPEPQPQPRSENEALRQLLMQNGIDPSVLSPVQLALFSMSAPDRRDYLLQLWRICPPVRSAAENNQAATSIENETALAEMRMNQQHRPTMATDEAMSLDGTTVHVAHQQPPQPQESQTVDGRWLQSESATYMEPYMMSGYEELARREYLASTSPPSSEMADATPRSRDVGASYSQAMDPVYNNRLWTPGRASWPSSTHSTIEMENQYGTLMAMRDSEMEL